MWPCLASLDKRQLIIFMFYSRVITLNFCAFLNFSVSSFCTRLSLSNQCYTGSMQMVTLGDMKPDPVLWHEQSNKKPWEDGRYTPC